jgi:hypothetical protein
MCEKKVCVGNDIAIKCGFFNKGFFNFSFTTTQQVVNDLNKFSQLCL